MGRGYSSLDAEEWTYNANLVIINTLLPRLRQGSYNFSKDNDRNNGSSTFLGATVPTSQLNQDYQ